MNKLIGIRPLTPAERTKRYREKHGERYRISSLKCLRKKSAWVWEFKKKLRCSICGEDHPSCLDFHHRDPSKKEFSMGRLLRKSNKEDAMKEIKKCDILCSNCHRKMHWPHQLPLL